MKCGLFGGARKLSLKNWNIYIKETRSRMYAGMFSYFLTGKMPVPLIDGRMHVLRIALAHVRGLVPVKMALETFTGYSNFAALAVLLTLCVAKFKRRNRIVFPAVALSAIVFSFHWILLVFNVPHLSNPGLAGALEILASLLILAAVMTEDRDMSLRTMMMVVLPVLIFINAVLFIYIFFEAQRDTFVVQLVPAGRLCLALFGLLAFWTRGISAPHYAVQTFMFLCIGAAMDVAIALFPDQPGWVSIMSPVADTFAFISIIMYVDSLGGEENEAIAETASPARGDEALAACDRIAVEMSKLDTTLPDDAWFAQGLCIVARSIQDAFGYKHISIIKWNGQDPRARATDAFVENGHSREAHVTLSATAMAKLLSGRDVLVSDNLREDARLVGCAFEELEWNSAAMIPFPQKKDLAYFLVLGDRPDAFPLGASDAGALRKMKPHLDVFFAYLHTRGELYSVANFDPVTLQHNYSSFQRILARAMVETDKSGGAFALALFDVDKFYILNEKLGYEPGDQILRELGNMIRDFTGNNEVGRVGADEFAVIMRGDNDSVRGQLEEILSKIKEKAVSLWPDLPMSLSVAYTLYPFDFLEQTSVFSKMREGLATGASSMGKLLRVKCS